MKLDGLLIHLQSWTQAEIAAQRTLLSVLDSFEAAVLSNQTDGLLTAGGGIEEALENNVGRDVRRRDLMNSFAGIFGVPAATLSLTSVLERAAETGASTAGLGRLRNELRGVVQEVAKKARLLTVLATHHRGVLMDVLAILGTSSDCEEARNAGVLLDAEA